MKKTLKIIGISLLIVIALLLASPFIFQSQIQDMVKRFINENVNAKVEFTNVSLSFLSSFPQAHVNVNDLVITNFKPFENETFATAKTIAFDMSVKELFKNQDKAPIIINSITVDEALVTIKTDKFGNNNYDIAKEKDLKTSANTTATGNFKFNIEDYAINNSAFNYVDEKSNTTINVTELNHSGKGTFSAEVSELNTTSKANVTLSIDSTKYLNNNSIKLDALLDLDLTENKYTFKENKGLINQLPLEFNGFIKMLDEGQEIDLTFTNPSSSFKDFLAVIPEAYSKNLEQVTTTGDFKVNGVIKGMVTDSTIPNLDINITSNNASFKYPNLPKSVENIIINTSIKNTTGLVDDTFLNLKTLNFKIDQDIFKSSATIKNLTKNQLINAHIDGVLNLANITKAYPIELEKELSGILKGKFNTRFDMNALKTNAFSRIKNNGSVTITDFIFSSEDIVNPIHISNADLTFKPGTVSLNSFDAKTGKSDLKATGTIKNLLGFLLSDNKLQGNFNVNSNTFAVSDFMVEDETVSKNNKTSTDSESLKIPAFLDCTINADAKTVLYDNLTLKNVKGMLFIKDEQATLSNMSSSLFDGELVIAGNVSTKSKTPTFDMDLGIEGFDISKSFSGLELLQNLAPVAKVFQGKLNTVINLNGTLNQEFTPNLSSITGNALAEILTNKIEPKNEALFNKLKGALDFIDFDKLDLKDLKTKLSFKNGVVSVKPFNLKYEDINITVEGSHGFDETLNYNAVFNVPAKYLGSDVNRLIGKINDPEVNKITIPVTANIGGSYTNPTVKTDLTSGITNLTKQLIEIEKKKLIDQGKDEIKDLLGDVLGGNNTETDSTSANSNTDVKDIIDDVFGGNQTPTDTSSTKQSDPVKDILGGIFGKKKKKKDSIN